jgi:hypothetical protein
MAKWTRCRLIGLTAGKNYFRHKDGTPNEAVLQTLSYRRRIPLFFGGEPQ